MKLVYVGNSNGLERILVPRARIPAYLFPMKAPTSPRALMLLAAAAIRSALVILRTRPRVTFATGGYVSAPAVVASWLFRVPVVMFLPDVVPGKAVAALVPLARRITTSTDDALEYLPRSKSLVTGYPVRPWFETASRAQGRARFGIPDDAQLVCVFGGSQGARAVNTALAACLPALLDRAHVLHVSGEARLTEAQLASASLSGEQRSRYHLFPYLHDQDMADAIAAADLALCRSGASVLGELPILGVPAILVPLPASGVHQDRNAHFLAKHGAAIVIPEQETGERLESALLGLLSDPGRLAHMADAATKLARPDAASAIASVIQETAR